MQDLGHKSRHACCNVGYPGTWVACGAQLARFISGTRVAGSGGVGVGYPRGNGAPKWAVDLSKSSGQITFG